MKFMIFRTSGDEPSPCDEAFLHGITPMGKNIWVIDINSLDELLAFSNKYGDIIVGKCHRICDDLPCIEIYDTYRE